jgi:hypothetical protein
VQSGGDLGGGKFVSHSRLTTVPSQGTDVDCFSASDLSCIWFAFSCYEPFWSLHMWVLRGPALQLAPGVDDHQLSTSGTDKYTEA